MVDVSCDWLIDDLVSQDVGLILKELGNFSPESCKRVSESSLVVEKILKSLSSIKGKVIFDEFGFDAFFNERVALFIHRDTSFYGEWEWVLGS